MSNGNRPVFGDQPLFQNDPQFKDYIHFFEYFHGDTGKGLGRFSPDGLDGHRCKDTESHIDL